MDFIALRRDLHHRAQKGWCEYYATARAWQLCAQAGFEVKPFTPKTELLGYPTDEEVAQAKADAVAWGADAALVQSLDVTGLVAEKRFGPGPVVVMRFDMDAVEVSEAQKDHRPADAGWASVSEGVCHSCGHDGHTAIGCGLAALVGEKVPQWRGALRLLFQPAEEGVRGGKAMAEAGLVDDADYFIALHLGLGLPLGSVVTATDGFLSTLKFDAAFEGVPAHAGGAPEEGKNALLASCTAALGLHAIAPHSGGATRVNVGRLEAGEGRNVIAPKALLKAEVRGDSGEIVDYLYRRAQQVLQGAALTQGVSVECRVVGQSVGSFSDPALSDVARRAAEAVGFEGVIQKRHMSGSDDAAWLMNRTRERGGLATYLGLGASNTAGHHQSTFDFDERCLEQGAQWLYALLEELMN